MDCRLPDALEVRPRRVEHVAHQYEVAAHDLVRLVRAPAEGFHHVCDLLAVAVIRPGNRVVMRYGDQARTEIDEGEHHALRLERDGRCR